MSLSAGGFQDPSSESSRATQLLAEKFGQGNVQLLFMVTAPDGVRGEAAGAAGADIVNLSRTRRAWWRCCRRGRRNRRPRGLFSRDGRSGLIVADIAGGEKEAPQRGAGAR